MPTVTISSPTEDGPFSGAANGRCSPPDGTVVVKFWRTDPTAHNPEPPPDAEGNGLSTDAGWGASLDLSGVAGTTTGYFRVIYTVGGESATANVSPLTWSPPS